MFYSCFRIDSYSGAPNPAAAPPQPPPAFSLQKFGLNAQQRMKKINWKALRPHNLSENCFWTNQHDLHTKENDLIDELSQHFSLPNKNVANGPYAKSHISLRVLDQNGAQNLMISLRVLFKNSSHEEIKQSILRCDTSVICSTFVETLLKCLPQPNQMKELYKMQNDGIELLDVEKLVANLANIENLKVRLHCINFKLGYNDMVKELEPNITAGAAACEEIMSSSKFGKILALILSIGNLMNSGSTLGGATGFELAILTKLHDVKSSDSKYTLLHFLVEKIKKELPESLNFADELVHLDVATHSNFDEIKETVGKIKTSLKELQNELEHYDESSSSEDKFVEVMSPFALECHRQLMVLEKLMNQMQSTYIEVGKHFAFDINKYSMDDFFLDIKTFKNLFARANTELVKTQNSKGKQNGQPVVRLNIEKECEQPSLNQNITRESCLDEENSKLHKADLQKSNEDARSFKIILNKIRWTKAGEFLLISFRFSSV